MLENRLHMATCLRPLLPLPSYRARVVVAQWSSCKPILQFTISLRSAKKLKPFIPFIAFNPSADFDTSPFEEDDGSKVAAPMPPKSGRYEVVLDNEAIRTLDLSPFENLLDIAHPKELLEKTVGFSINYAREDESDPRELSEFPDIRLWFIRLDAKYPWVPVVLDWRAGELARYAAMLVPHQMSMKMGVVYNPEALELFIMNKVFIVYSWLKQHNLLKPRVKAYDMARMLGFGIGNELFDLIDQKM